ncbi:hypothetical protein ACFYUV_20450 [Nonomuraea sp. NPDC003560]|uniref:hypothetical protein n=1 Tax=Nonomuraea sp. NPDC003560 TaxID=3364341 RepID=UPI00367A5AA1
MRITKSAIVLSTAALAAGLVGAIPASADVPIGALQIVEVGTDAMGSDTFANRNREFVTFKSNSRLPVDITGLVVQDNWSHGNSGPHTCNKYVINALPGQASGAVLGVGETVTVFNGARVGGNYKTASGEYRLFADSDVDCGTAGHVFNNDADTVWLTSGVTDVHSKSWDWNGGYTVK